MKRERKPVAGFENGALFAPGLMVHPWVSLNEVLWSRNVLSASEIIPGIIFLTNKSNLQTVHDRCSLFVPFVKTQCQQELDQILERISKMPFRDNRGPLEDLYALHIPNCDKRGQYNLKQVTLQFPAKKTPTQFNHNILI